MTRRKFFGISQYPVANGQSFSTLYLFNIPVFSWNISPDKVKPELRHYLRTDDDENMVFNRSDPRFGYIEPHPRKMFPLPCLGIFHHKKRGSLYGIATFKGGVQGDLKEGDTAVCYVDNQGRWWVRRDDEFMDGRFEKIE